MKIPSVSKLYLDASETFKRFPFVILFSILGAIMMIILIEQNQSEDSYLGNAAMVCALGISFLLSLSLRGEVLKLTGAKNYLVQAVGAVILVGYYFYLPKELSVVDITRFFLFALGFHLLVSFTAFMNKDVEHQHNIDAFWRFNKLFFLRILISAVFSGVLYVGLVIAIVSFDKLFEVDIKDNIYPQLFFFILGIFNTWFFLSGIPKSVNDFYEEEIYPKGLKIFTQFVLLPLVMVYLIILYLYMGKIIIMWNLPVGWVSYLILGFSITGILSLLLIYPIRNYEENKWIKVFSKWFYIALLPLIVLLFIAILTRLFEYGITEKRYFVFVLACWLTFISIYFLISKTKNIKIIPISLCLLAFATSFGPWGAFSVSERSQMNRLEKILTENKILVDGKIKPVIDNVQEKISDEDIGNISSIMDFLGERKEMKSVQKWFDTNIDSVLSKERYTQSTDVMKLMGLKYQHYYRGFGEDTKQKKYFNFNFEKSSVMKVTGFDYFANVSIYKTNNNLNASVNDSTYVYQLDSNKLSFTLLKAPAMMSVKFNNEEISLYNFSQMLDSLKTQGDYERFSQDKGVIKIENNNVNLTLNISNLGGYFEKQIPTVNSISGDMFVTLKKK